MSDIMFVAVPQGYETPETPAGGARVARLAVLVVPRLDPGPVAASGLGSWPPPDLLAAILRVGIADAAGQVTAIDVPPPHVTAQPGLWAAVFGPDPTVHATGTVRGASQAPVAVAPTSVDADAVSATFTAVVPAVERADLDTRVRAELSGRWAGTPTLLAAPPEPGETPPAPPPDFHRAVSLLREHPGVLRALGLLFTLRVPAKAIPDAGRVEVTWPGANADPARPPVVAPWTRFGSAFRPASTPGIHAGMLTLSDDPAAPGGDTDWSLVTVDVEGGAERLRAAAVSAPDGPDRLATLPALGTAGIQLVRRGRQRDFDARQDAAARTAGPAPDEAELDAQDLLLGYRLDVAPRGGDWLSLHEREATYRAGELAVDAPGREEGHLKARAALDDGSGVLHADEVVARWTGWSLAVPRPRLDRGPVVDLPAGDGLRWSYAVPPGSLPALRFAETYRVRARVADVGGGGLDRADPAADRCALSIPFRRWEPLPAPTVAAPDGEPGPGESALDVVVRSDTGLTVAGFAAAEPAYLSRPDRALAPPPCSFALAEYHGALDALDDDTAFALLDAAVVPDPAAGGVTAWTAGRDPELRAWPQGWPALGTKALRVVERLPGDDARTLAWEGDTLVARLRPAEQVRVELSSFLRADVLDHFAARDPLLAGPSAGDGRTVPQAAAEDGRHPVLTPATALRLVHAVRRPRAVPGGGLSAQRGRHDTFATLVPDLALFGADAASTARLELVASWTERDDERLRDRAEVAVAGIPIADPTGTTTDPAAPTGPVRHDFGDTRHRTVTYDAVAVGRFRHCFHAGEDDTAFRVRGTFGPVEVPSSARPPSPEVVAVRPAFAWTRGTDGPATVHRRRTVLRVELARPWFRSGDSEQLAVVVPATDPPPPALWPVLTELARDPVQATPAPARWPAPERFPACRGPVRGVGLADDPDVRVLAVPHDVCFNEGRWYADVELLADGAGSYRPFVRLAVARYQPTSLDGLELSPVTACERVGLLPERTLTVRREADEVVVVLEGLGPDGRPTSVSVALERLEGAAEPAEVEIIAAGPLGGVAAWVPAEPVGSSPSEPPLGPGEMTTLPGTLPPLAWGALGESLRLPIPAGPGPLRVRVREVEDIGTVATDDGGPSWGLTEHAVFVDTVAVPSG